MLKLFYPVKFASQLFIKEVSQRKKSILSSLLVLVVLANLFIPLIEKPVNKSVALAQGIGFVPRYPTRLRYVVEEINQASQQIDYLNKELKKLTEGCDCANAQSQVKKEGVENIKPASPEVFGEPCPKRIEIEKTQLEIRNKIDQIFYLRKLLKKEMEAGLKAELETLREDEASELEINLNNLLDSTSVENIIAPALENTEILDNELYSVEKKGKANWEKGIIFGLMACILSTLGEQKPIKIIFDIGLALKKIELGKVKIEKFGLNLPAKVKLADMPEIEDFKIPLPNIITLPKKQIIFHPPSFKMPGFPSANFSCLQLSSQPYQSQSAEKEESNYPTGLGYYLQTFSWLSQKCHDIPGMKNSLGIIRDNRCFDIDRVVPTIIEECDDLWKGKKPRPVPPNFQGFWTEGSNCLINYNKDREECVNICKEAYETVIDLRKCVSKCDSKCWYLQQECEPTGQVKCLHGCEEEVETCINKCERDCIAKGYKGDVYELCKDECEEDCRTKEYKCKAECDEPCICKDYKDIQKECQTLFNQLGESIPSNCDLDALKNKCFQLKEEGIEERPEPCKFLPLFIEELEKPESETYQQSSTSCSEQTIFDNPGTGISLECPLSVSTIPKIKLPDIKIPNIRLPDFNFMPFFKLDLPNFIFEDLITPDLELCNLDNCKDLIPPIDFQHPVLIIPDIEIPPLEALGIQIGMDKIEFPPIPIGMPKLNPANLITPKLQIQKISVPSPEITSGFDIDMNISVLNLLLGLLQSFIHIPSGCISIGVSLIPLTISFPDYYFYWPKFPEIPDLCNNEYISVNEYCQKIKTSLDQIVSDGYKACKDKCEEDCIKKYTIYSPEYDMCKDECEEDCKSKKSIINKIQNTVNQAVQKHVQENLDEIAASIEKLVKEEVNKRLYEIKKEIESGAREIYLEDIVVPMKEVNEQLAEFPREVFIDWIGECRDECEKDCIKKYTIYSPEYDMCKDECEEDCKSKEYKEITLKNPIEYQLPSIPLDKLSYKKKIFFPIPGFQYTTFRVKLDFLGNYPSYKGLPPSGGNPYPIDKINTNLEKITEFKNNINEFSKKINQILR